MTKAIILLSGGLDSTVVLAIALSRKCTCYTFTFNYQQRNYQELEAAKAIAAYYHVPHQIILLDPLPFASSSLVSHLAVPTRRTTRQITTQGIPNTYVPARNTLFLAYSMGLCEAYQADEIHFGPNRLDTFGYPDCCPPYLEAFQRMMQLATKQAVEGAAPQLITPLLHLDKTQIILEGMAFGAPLEMTWSCYSPTEQSLPCHACDACLLRAEGFRLAERE